MKIQYEIINEGPNNLLNNLICRACMSSDKKIINNNITLESILKYTIESEESCRIPLKDVFQCLTSINISNDEDIISNVLCNSCVQNLIIYYAFRIQCLYTDDILKNISNNVNSLSNSFHLNASIDSDCEQKILDNYNIDKNTSNIEEIFESQLIEVPDQSEETIYNDGNMVQNNIFECDVCGKKMKHKISLKRHILRHDKKRFKCQLCVREFFSKGELSKHSIKHQNNKNYVCTTCGLTFSRKDSLTMHNKIHLGLKPHQCPHCDKSFLNSYNLKHHIYTHTKHKPYFCVLCDKNFSQKSSLSNHLKSSCRKLKELCND